MKVRVVRIQDRPVVILVSLGSAKRASDEPTPSQASTSKLEHPLRVIGSKVPELVFALSAAASAHPACTLHVYISNTHHALIRAPPQHAFLVARNQRRRRLHAG